MVVFVIYYGFRVKHGMTKKGKIEFLRERQFYLSKIQAKGPAREHPQMIPVLTICWVLIRMREAEGFGPRRPGQSKILDGRPEYWTKKIIP